MHRFLTTAGLALATLAFLAGGAHAQVIHYPRPVVVTPAPVVTSFYSPSTVYYTPTTTYYTPTVPFYTPTTTFYAPTTAFYTPVTSYYAPPPTVYSAPLLTTPGTVTTRTFYGFGIFRPRGLYTQSYYTPGVTVAPTTSFYAPVYFR